MKRTWRAGDVGGTPTPGRNDEDPSPGRGRCHAVRVDARGWWTVVLTALAGPAGSIGIGIGLARWAEATTGGMAVLAAGVVGLWIGAPVVAFIVFVVCLFTLMRPAALRRWVAILVMLAFAFAESVVVLVGLRFVGGSAQPEVGLVVVAIIAMGVLGAGAYAALAASRRRIDPVTAD